MADAAEVDRRYLGRIETGEVQEPGVETVGKLAKALGVSIRQLANPGWYDDEADNDWLAGLRSDKRLDDEGKALIERLIRLEIEQAERRESPPNRQEKPKRRAV